MNIPKIDHIGIMVKDLEAAKRTYSEGLGLKLAKEETNEAHGLKVAFFSCGEVMIEVIEPIGPGIAMDFVEQTGGGVHHICFAVDDADAAFAEIKAGNILDSFMPAPVTGAAGSTRSLVGDMEGIAGRMDANQEIVGELQKQMEVFANL